MNHYLTEHEYNAVGKWVLQPNDLQITTGSEDNIISMPKIGSFWRHADTGE